MYAEGGMIDDLPKLKALLNQPQGAAHLSWNHSYNVSNQLYVTKPLDMNGASIALDPNVGFPNYQTIHVKPTMGPRLPFTQAIVQGAREIAFKYPGISVGETLVLWLGDSPWGDVGTYEDGKAPHACMLVQVVSLTVTGIVIDRPIPYAIKGKSHYAYVVSAPANNVTIRNGTIRQKAANGGGLFAEFCRNASLIDLEIDRSIVLGFLENFSCHNLRINSVTRAEFAVQSWSAHGVVIDNVIWSNAKAGVGCNGFIDAEHDTDIHIGTADLSCDEDYVVASIEGAGDGGIASSVTFGTLKLRGNGRAFFEGGGYYHIDHLHLYGQDVGAIDLSRVDHLHLVGKELGLPIRWEWIFNLTGATITLPSGVYRRMRVKFSAVPQGQVYFRTTTDPDYSKDLATLPIVAGEWVEVPCVTATGSNNGSGDVNTLRYMDKFITAALAESVTMEVVIEYWPLAGGA